MFGIEKKRLTAEVQSCNEGLNLIEVKKNELSKAIAEFEEKIRFLYQEEKALDKEANGIEEVKQSLEVMIFSNFPKDSSEEES
jgi:acyl-[acyl carrier protein]--UDP-N-acetylglucosamine O-acyltransferase